jgi:two-component sensor histidine kinase
MTVALSQIRHDVSVLGGTAAEQHAELRHALEQKTALLHEVDHRVKNNLQLIASLLLLQTRRVKDPTVRRALNSMLERVNAVATVHRRLFQNEDVAMFDVAAFVRDLADDALGAANRPDIRIALDAQSAQVPAALAAPLALVINELLLNALAHAFPPGRGGMITLSISGNRHALRIEVADDGVGMAETTSAVDGAGLGLTIVDLLSQQLRAEVERDWTGRGVRTVLQLPLEGVS